MDVKRIHAAAAAYARRGDRALAERLGFFGALWGVQECIEREVSTSHPYACPSSAEVAAWAAAGTPVLSQAPAYPLHPRLTDHVSHSQHLKIHGLTPFRFCFHYT